MSASTAAAIESGRLSNKRLRWGISRLIDLGLGFVLLRAALAHLANPYFFLSSVYDYELVRPELGELVAIVLPHLELAIALCLLLGLWREAALVATALLLTAFVAVQTAAWTRGLEISCGCFGATGSETVGAATVLRDAAVAYAAWVSIALSR